MAYKDLKRGAEYKKYYYQTHKEAYRERLLKWRKENQELYHEQNFKYYWQNRYKILTKSKRRREEHRELISQKKRKHYQKHKEELLKKMRLYRESHREKRSEYGRKYRKTPTGKEVGKRNQAKRRAAKYGTSIEARLTAAEWQEIKLVYGYRCVYCGEKKKLSQDHIIPLRKGGYHVKENVVPACKRCNSSKNQKDLQEFGRGIQVVLF